jgi:glycosyl transferase family 25
MPVKRLVPQPLRFRLWQIQNAIAVRVRRLGPSHPTFFERSRARWEVKRRHSRSAAGLDRLPPPLVINLAARTDRLEAVTAELQRIGVETFERVDAVAHRRPKIGCSLSHIACVVRLLSEPWEAVLICEDDASFTASRAEIDVLVDSFLDDDRADVACLAYFTRKSTGHDRLYRRATATQTRSCYVVKRDVAEELIAIWREGIDGLERGGDPHVFAGDRIWWRLQRDRVFVVPMNRVARQAPGYSDIEQRVVAYTY